MPPVDDGHDCDGGLQEHGPCTLSELFQWPTEFCSKLFEAHDSCAQHLMDCHIALTSEFSGMGTAELAMKLVVDAMTNHDKQHYGGGGGSWRQGETFIEHVQVLVGVPAYFGIVMWMWMGRFSHSIGDTGAPVV